MANKKHFLHDLERGSTAEQIVVSLLTQAGFDSETDDKARIKWDVKSAYGQSYFTTEVKYDEYEARSGNIAIEVYNPRLVKPSGVTATEAFFWAHVLKDKSVWMTPVADLRAYIDANAPRRVVTHGGDDNATLWLYASEKILHDVFTRVDKMTVDEMQQFIIVHMEELNE
jgi:hypothetical protein